MPDNMQRNQNALGTKDGAKDIGELSCEYERRGAAQEQMGTFDITRFVPWHADAGRGRGGEGLSHD